MIETPTAESREATSVAAAPSAVLATAPSPRSFRRKGVLKVMLEVGLIGAGVFLGLAGDQWREDAEHRELARATLARFRTEMTQNRDAIAAVRDYHAKTLDGVRAYLAADRQRRNTADVGLQGLQPVTFTRTAWDLALATQALGYIESDIAVSLSRIYNAQQSYADLTRGMTQALYLLPRRENFDAFAGALEVYFSDVVLIEPQLLAMYAELLPRLDKALGTATPAPVAP